MRRHRPVEVELRPRRLASRLQLRLEVGAGVVRLIRPIGSRELRPAEFAPARLLFAPTDELGKVENLALTRFGQRGDHLPERLLYGHGQPSAFALLLAVPSSTIVIASSVGSPPREQGNRTRSGRLARSVT